MKLIATLKNDKENSRITFRSEQYGGDTSQACDKINEYLGKGWRVELSNGNVIKPWLKDCYKEAFRCTSCNKYVPSPCYHNDSEKCNLCIEYDANQDELDLYLWV